jgi:hypothetical protein
MREAKYYAAAILAAILLAIAGRAPAVEWETVSMEKAVKMGTGWGSKKTVERMREIFRDHYPILWFEGSSDAGDLAAFIGPETRWTGNPWSRTKDFKDLGEVGLLSLKRATAKNYDVDACDPRANVWADSLEIWKKRHAIKCQHPWLKGFPKWESDLIADAVREAGAGWMKEVIERSNIEHLIVSITHPHSFLLKWLKKQDPASFNGSSGKTHPAQAAFRTAWVAGSRKKRVQFWGGGKEGRKRMIQCARYHPDRPEGLAPFPGDKQHGYCTVDADAWGKPPKWRWKKTESGWMANRWKEFCPTGESCTYEEVHAKWKKSRQEMGLLPSDEEYARARAEMEAAGCWPPGID